LVNFKIFKDAFHIYQSGEVYFLGNGEHWARFIAKDVEVRVEITASGTKFRCGCEHHLKKQLQDKLCKRVIAVCLYLCYKRGKVDWKKK